MEVSFPYGGELPLPFNHAASIVELPDGDLLVAWYAGAHELAPDVAIYMVRRAACSGAWCPPRKVIDSPGLSNGNPVLFVDRQQTVWCFYVTVHGSRWDDAVLAYRTSSNGLTWSDEVTMSHRPGLMPAIKPITLANGEIVLPLNQEAEGAPDDWSSLFMISSDGGLTWQRHEPILTEPGNIQPTVQQLADGSLLALMRTRARPGRLWTMTSLDNGRSWSVPRQTAINNPNARVDMVRLSSNRIVLAYNDSPTQRTPLSLALSTDGGRTWQGRMVLGVGAGVYDYPAIIQARDASIHVVYSHNKTRIKHVKLSEEELM